MTPLMVACLQNKNTEITRLLLTSNADMSKVNKKGYTPLHLLTVKDDLEDVNVQKGLFLSTILHFYFPSEKDFERKEFNSVIGVFSFLNFAHNAQNRLQKRWWFA